jgi:hypothetical protein
MTSAAQPRSDRGLTATPTIAQSRKNVPIISTLRPWKKICPSRRSLMPTAP